MGKWLFTAMDTTNGNLFCLLFAGAEEIQGRGKSFPFQKRESKNKLCARSCVCISRCGLNQYLWIHRLCFLKLLCDPTGHQAKKDRRGRKTKSRRVLCVYVCERKLDISKDKDEQQEGENQKLKRYKIKIV